MGYLYSLTFANHKRYVGITTKSAMERFSSHARSVIKGSSCSIHAAWRKYGAPYMTVLAILENALLCETEIRAIESMQTLVPKGYNESRGGDLSPALSPIVTARISATLTGRKLSSETRRKISAALLSRGDRHPMKAPAARARAAILLKQRPQFTRNGPHTAMTKAAISSARLSPEVSRRISDEVKSRGTRHNMRTPEARERMKGEMNPRRIYLSKVMLGEGAAG